MRRMRMTGLPKSQLVILPGTTHLTVVMDNTERLVAMSDDSLVAPLPEAG
jgi:hypothetical protein